MAKLTAIKVRNAKPKDKPYKLPDGYGLYLHVSISGKKTWRYRFELEGKESTFVLGEYPQMGLEAARSARVAAREKVKDGINPSQDRKDKRRIQNKNINDSVNSFETIAVEWMEKQKDRWSSNHHTSIFRSLKKNVFPYLGNVGIDQITPPMLVETLERIEKRNALEIARKTLQRVNSIYMYAVRTGKTDINPAASLQGTLKTRKVSHMAALTEQELPDFLVALDKARIHITTKLGLKFLILTAARSGEVRLATWNEFNLEESMWRIPAERMKMDSPHNIPLSRQAIDILEKVGNTFGKSGYAFPAVRDNNKPMSQNTMLFALHKLGYKDRATVHGFRSSFSTIGNEKGFNGDVIERALAHIERNRVRAAYHRSEYIEQRRELMQWWADYLDDLRQIALRA